MHEQEPSKVLALARALAALPTKVLLIGCEPYEIEDLREELSPPVAAALDPAVQRIILELRQLAD
jgi:hydrogenase maturation protease